MAKDTRMAMMLSTNKTGGSTQLTKADELLVPRSKFRIVQFSDAWRSAADIFAVLTSASLPWSTTLPAVFTVALLACLVPVLDVRAFFTLLKRPICAVPVAIFWLAVAGVLWSDAPWGARLYAVGPTVKLLVIPMLMYHFSRSSRGWWIFVAFMVSCALLSLVSWAVFIHPAWSIKPPSGRAPGIFVKNYIDQSQEFALCAVAVAYPALLLLRQKRAWQAVLLLAFALSLLINMSVVVVSRTAIVTMPIMLIAFSMLHLRWQGIAAILCVSLMLGVLAWQTSPQLRMTLNRISDEYRLYHDQNVSTSIGLRLEFWRKSLGFFAEAPIVGHGTGSTRGLFERAATGNQNEPSSEVIGNPHNQTLNVAVQWGVIGIVLLYAMWLLHLSLFWGGGSAGWIGFLVVMQNVLTSVFNSHLFDFHEGWMYVLGVGVAGGVVLQAKQHEAIAEAK